MPARRSQRLPRSVAHDSFPESPEWKSAKDVFKTPKSPSPVRRLTRRSSIYQRKSTKTDISKFKAPNGPIVSPPGVKTRARRSSIYQKGGSRLLSPETMTRARRASMYVSRPKPATNEFSKVFHTPLKAKSPVNKTAELKVKTLPVSSALLKDKTPQNSRKQSTSPKKSVTPFRSPPIPTLRKRTASGAIKTPAHDTTKKTPAHDTTKKTPALDTTKKTPALDMTKKTPARDTTKKTPALDTTKKTPALDTTKKTPALDTTKKTPARDTTKKTPARDTTKKTPARDTTKKTPARDTTKKTPARDTTKETTALDTTKKTPAHDTPKETPARRSNRAISSETKPETPSKTPVRSASSKSAKKMAPSKIEKGQSANMTTSTPAKSHDETVNSKSFYGTPGETPVLSNVSIIQSLQKGRKPTTSSKVSAQKSAKKTTAVISKTPSAKKSHAFDSPRSASKKSTPSRKTLRSAQKVSKIVVSPYTQAKLADVTIELTPVEEKLVFKIVTNDTSPEKATVAESVSPKPSKLAKLADDAVRDSTPKPVRRTSASPKQLATIVDEKDSSLLNNDNTLLGNETFSSDSRSSRCIIL